MSAPKETLDNRPPKRSDTEQMCREGQNIVYALAFLNIALNTVEWLTNDYYSIMGLAIQFVISIALCLGFNWLRYLFAIGSVTVALYSLWGYFYMPLEFLESSLAMQIYYVIFISYLLTCAALLLFNKKIRAFFRSKKADKLKS